LADACEQHGLAAVAEGFADRGYRSDGSLSPRSSAGAVLDRGAALAQALAFARGDAIAATDGSRLALRVRSLCVHSDTPGAAQIAAGLRAALEDARIDVAAFA
jgi:5-oxoprolinase (ATP-hydrolysing) subunit A